MAAPSGEQGGRVAVVGAATSIGSRLRVALAEHGVSGARVSLFGGGQGEPALSEYGGEARLIQQPDPSEVVRHEIVFLCAPADAILATAGRADPKPTVIDLTGSVSERGRIPLVHLGLNPEAARGHEGVLAVPHPLSSLLAELLHPIDRAFGVRRAVAVLMRPASDFGPDGMDELREQAVRLLRFERMPREIFGRQLAFNVIPQQLLGKEEPRIEARITAEVSRLLGWDEPRLAIRLLVVPVFHGHAVAMRLDVDRTANPTDLARVLERARGISVASDKAAATPLEALESRRTDISEVSADGLGGFWLWAVAGEAGAGDAEQAVRLAAALRNL